MTMKSQVNPNSCLIVFKFYCLGEPEIECGYGVVHFRVHTAKGEASQVFVKGNSG